MFTGVGGFELGLPTEWECVGMSEIDKYASIVLDYRFKDVKNYGDAKEINPRELPEFDLLCGGFPCQAFSIAGKRRGFEDTHGTLFFEIARILKIKRPTYLLLENVKGLLNHEKGNTFRKIIQTLSELGYDVQWLVLNSKFHGVPQNRERVFIIGSLRGTSRPEILPFRENATEVPEIPKRQIISVAIRNKNRSKHQNKAGKKYGDYEKKYQLEQRKDGNSYVVKSSTQEFMIYNKISENKRMEETIGTVTQAFGRRGCSKEEGRAIREHKTPEESSAMTSQMGTGGNNIPMIANCIDANYYKGNSPSHIEQGRVRNVIQNHFPRSGNPKQGGHGLLESSEHCFALDRTPHYVNKLRRLTPKECERLQGFPDDWTLVPLPNGKMMSDTQRYKMMGNAVTVNVIKALGVKCV